MCLQILNLMNWTLINAEYMRFGNNRLLKSCHYFTDFKQNQYFFLFGNLRKKFNMNIFMEILATIDICFTLTVSTNFSPAYNFQKIQTEKSFVNCEQSRCLHIFERILDEIPKINIIHDILRHKRSYLLFYLLETIFDLCEL